MADSRIALPDSTSFAVQHLIRRVVEALPDQVLTPTARLAVAFSGGMDSAVLLTILVRLRDQYGFQLRAVHVHHGLSPNADAWQQACEARCRELAVPLTVARVTVARDTGEGLEAAARHARWQVLRSQPVDWLVLGHHADDQAETLLFRLARGAGVRGAAAMQAVEPARKSGSPGCLRPLLGIRRAELVTFAADAGLSWVEDESNADLRYARNHLRHVVLPALEAAVPGCVTALGRAAGHFREAETLLSDLAQLDRAACGGRTYALSTLLALPDARVRNLLREDLFERGERAVSAQQMAEWLRQLREIAGQGGQGYWPFERSALVVYRGRGWWVPRLQDEPAGFFEWRGETAWMWRGEQFALVTVQGEGVSVAWLRAQWNNRSLRVGVPRQGMQLRLAHNRPRRSLKKLCQEAGIPEALRSRLPVLWWRDEAVWVGGLGVACGEWSCSANESGVMLNWSGAKFVVAPAERG